MKSGSVYFFRVNDFSFVKILRYTYIVQHLHYEFIHFTIKKNYICYLLHFKTWKKRFFIGAPALFYRTIYFSNNFFKRNIIFFINKSRIGTHVRDYVFITNNKSTA